MELKDLTGKHIFSGVELGTTEVERWTGNIEEVSCVKFELDGITYIATEDPADGYRSYLDELKVCETPTRYRTPNILITCKYVKIGEYGNACDVLEFIDVENGKVFLRIGTENTDDYYPYCIFSYTPENIHLNDNKREEI